MNNIFDVINIIKYYLNISEEIVIASELGIPGGLAIDVESRMIYWTDKENNVICRSHLNGMGKETLIEDNLNEPLSIMVDTKNRYVQSIHLLIIISPWQLFIMVVLGTSNLPNVITFRSRFWEQTAFWELLGVHCSTP